VFATHSAAVTAINADVVMLIASLPPRPAPAQFTHQSNNATASPLCLLHGVLVGFACSLLQISIKAECQTGAVVMSIL